MAWRTPTSANCKWRHVASSSWSSSRHADRAVTFVDQRYRIWRRLASARDKLCGSIWMLQQLPPYAVTMATCISTLEVLWSNAVLRRSLADFEATGLKRSRVSSRSSIVNHWQRCRHNCDCPFMAFSLNSSLAQLFWCSFMRKCVATPCGPLHAS